MGGPFYEFGGPIYDPGRYFKDMLKIAPENHSSGNLQKKSI